MSHLPPRDSLPSLLRTAWIVMAVFILSNMATPLYGHWQQALGFGATTLTLIFAAYILGLLMTLTLAGQLADHFGRKALLLPCVAIALVAAALFAVADSVPLLMLARWLTGVAVGIVVSAGMANVVEHAVPERKPLASLLASVAMVAGAGTGPLLAGVLAEYSPAPVTQSFALAGGVLVLALLAVLGQPHRRLAPAGKPLRLRLPSLPVGGAAVVGLGVAFFGPGITSTSFVLSLGPKLLAVLLGGASPLRSGAMAFAMFAVGVLAQFAARPRPLRQTFALSGLATLAAMLSLWAALAWHAPAMLLAAALLAGAGQGLGQLGGLTLIALNIEAERRAQANALFNMAGYVPAGVIPVATGWLIDRYGMVPAIDALAATLAVLAVLALGMLVRRGLVVGATHGRERATQRPQDRQADTDPSA